ncbi:MAG: T9SS type A sorting domain-containing protein [Saprospiraceae bacterium]|nr:T9SS type A sorting domain-containing protein [Saprospiraceae bacterium]
MRSVDFDGTESISNIEVVKRTTGGFAVTSVFPSPATGVVNVLFESIEETDIMVRLVDLSGRVVKECRVLAYIGVNQTDLDLTNINKGIYLIQIMNRLGESASYKVMKD